MLTSFGFSKQNLMGGNPNPGMWMVSDSMRRYEDEAQSALDSDMRACNAYQEARGRVRNCSPNTYAARRCRQTHATASYQAATRRLSNARMDIIPGAGHSLMVEDPNHVLDQLKIHLL